MDTLAFDGRMGAAGDMICAGLIAVGGDPAVLDPLGDALPVRFEVGATTKNGIRSTTFDVLLTDSEGDQDCSDHDHDHAHDHDHEADHSHNHDETGHTHDHSHDHTHAHSHSPDHSHSHAAHAEGAGVNRTYPEVVDLVGSLGLDADVEADALAVFELLGEAEAAVHGTDIDRTHFHEVGADDAIADVVGASLLLDDLGVERVLTTPLSTGGGDVEMSHGVYPVPAPAVVEIAERSSISLQGGPVDAELLTPTGAAILGALADGVATLPALSVDAVGYGAGDRSFPDHPNVLRTIVGDVCSADGDDHGHDHEYSHGDHEYSHDDDDHEHDHGVSHGDDHDHKHDHNDPHTHGHDPALAHDEIVVLETNVDDVPPEILGGLHDTLSAVGARDVTIVPTAMKKSRPGHLVSVICAPGDADAVAERLARETGTLGIRQTSATHRWIADRAFETVPIDVGAERFDVAVKVASTTDGDIYDVSAEYDDAAAVASRTNLPIREVMRRAEAKVHSSRSDRS